MNGAAPAKAPGGVFKNGAPRSKTFGARVFFFFGGAVETGGQTAS